MYHVELRQAAWFSAVPWSVMAVMGYFGGLWSDGLIRSGTSITLTRKMMQVSIFYIYINNFHCDTIQMETCTLSSIFPNLFVCCCLSSPPHFPIALNFSISATQIH